MLIIYLKQIIYFKVEKYETHANFVKMVCACLRSIKSYLAYLFMLQCFIACSCALMLIIYLKQIRSIPNRAPTYR